MTTCRWSVAKLYLDTLKRELNYATPYALGPQVPPEVCPGNALKVALDHLQQTYGLTTANKFGPLTLAAIQDRLIAQ